MEGKARRVKVVGEGEGDDEDEDGGEIGGNVLHLVDVQSNSTYLRYDTYHTYHTWYHMMIDGEYGIGTMIR